MPSYGDWVGTASRVVSAEVQWALVSSIDCVDRLAPAGTATSQLDGSCDHTSSHAITASDGWLTVDRRTVPATWRAIAGTTWSAGGCAGTIGEPWIAGRGHPGRRRRRRPSGR